MKPSSGRVRKWRNWFKEINDEILHLHNTLQIIDEIQIVITNNNISESRSILWNYFPKVFVYDAIFRISRICEAQREDDNKDKVNSLRALLEEFMPYHKFFTRRRFVGRINPPKPANITNKAYRDYLHSNEIFDKIVGSGKHLKKKSISEDIKELDSASKKIKKFRNKGGLAHSSTKKRLYKPLDFGEIENARTVITKIADKYFYLLNNAYCVHNQKIDITPIFLNSWIDNGDALGKIKNQIREMHSKYDSK